jgi:hypothetical protein
VIAAAIALVSAAGTTSSSSPWNAHTGTPASGAASSSGPPSNGGASPGPVAPRRAPA